MRAYCLLCTLLANTCAFTQTNLTGTNKPLVTAFGQPVGDSVIQKVGPGGGTVKSADGKLEVIFPAGAVDAETFVGVRPIHNQLTDDDNGSYQLEPSGTTFKKPVQLVFHYSDGNANSDLMRIGWQDDKGQWHRSKSASIDTIQRTITVLTQHFSAWAKFNRMYITPAATSLKVNKSVLLRIKVYPEKLTAADDNDLLATPNPADKDDDLVEAPENGFNTGQWTANGVVNGDGNVGEITPGEHIQATYKAPTVVPDDNPVSVSVQIYSNKNGLKLLLTSNITVIGDQYHFTYIHIDENGCYFTVDSSSCIFNMEKHAVRISNINNYKAWSDWPDCGGCHYEWTNKGSFIGLAEIRGIAGSSITPPKEDGGPTNVNVIFVPAMGNTPGATVHCKKDTRNIPSVALPAVPRSINFDVDGDNLIIHYMGKTGTNELVLEGHEEKTMIYMYKVGN